MKSMKTLVMTERVLGALQVGIQKTARTIQNVTYAVENAVLDTGYKIRKTMKKLPKQVTAKCIKFMLDQCKKQAKARKNRLQFIALEAERLEAEKKKLEKATAEYTRLGRLY